MRNSIHLIIAAVCLIAVRTSFAQNRTDSAVETHSVPAAAVIDQSNPISSFVDMPEIGAGMKSADIQQVDLPASAVKLQRQDEVTADKTGLRDPRTTAKQEVSLKTVSTQREIAGLGKGSDPYTTGQRLQAVLEDNTTKSYPSLDDGIVPANSGQNHSTFSMQLLNADLNRGSRGDSSVRSIADAKPVMITGNGASAAFSFLYFASFTTILGGFMNNAPAELLFAVGGTMAFVAVMLLAAPMFKRPINEVSRMDGIVPMGLAMAGFFSGVALASSLTGIAVPSGVLPVAAIGGMAALSVIFIEAAGGKYKKTPKNGAQKVAPWFSVIGYAAAVAGMIILPKYAGSVGVLLGLGGGIGVMLAGFGLPWLVEHLPSLHLSQGPIARLRDVAVHQSSLARLKTGTAIASAGIGLSVVGVILNALGLIQIPAIFAFVPVAGVLVAAWWASQR